MIATPTDELGRHWLAIWRDMAACCAGLPGITVPRDLYRPTIPAARYSVPFVQCIPQNVREA